MDDGGGGGFVWATARKRGPGEEGVGPLPHHRKGVAFLQNPH